MESGVLFSWTSRLFLYAILITIMGCSDAREIKNNGHDHHDHHHHDTTSPTTTKTVFFHKDGLKAGKTLFFVFPKTLNTNARFLPRQQAESIPFSTEQLPEILDYFSFPPDSKEAAIVQDSLHECERPPAHGETKFCATSLEQMLDSTLDVFGLRPSDHVPEQLTLLKTRMVDDMDKNRSAHLYQNFTVLEDPKEVEASMSVGCHILPYPYVVFYCHTQEGGTRLYKTALKGRDTGDLVEAAAICHMDTSIWDPDHASFRDLGLKRGDPVCHIFPLHNNFLWAYNPKRASATTSIS